MAPAILEVICGTWARSRPMTSSGSLTRLPPRPWEGVRRIIQVYESVAEISLQTAQVRGSHHAYTQNERVSDPRLEVVDERRDAVRAALRAARAAAVDADPGRALGTAPAGASARRAA